MQIPDDLSPPNEADALRLPPQTVVAAPIVAGECLETPPPFFGDSRPVRSAAEDDGSRRSRREARREASREAEEGEAAPAEPREPPSAPSNDERVIDN